MFLEEVWIVSGHFDACMTGLNQLLFGGEVLADDDVGVAVRVVLEGHDLVPFS